MPRLPLPFLAFFIALVIGVGAGSLLTYGGKMGTQSQATPQRPAQKRAIATIDQALPTAPQPDRLTRKPLMLDQKPRIVIIIDDLGFSVDQTRRLSDLPGPLTLSFLPYPGGLDEQARFARAGGHDVFLHLPMEPLSQNTDKHEGQIGPGPNALTRSMSDAVLKATLAKNLSAIGSISGVNNHMGSAFTQDQHRMKVVLEELSRRGLPFVDSVTDGHTAVTNVARSIGAPLLARDVFLDADFGKGGGTNVQHQLQELEQIASLKGEAIAIGHPYPTTIEALGPWLVTAPARGFEVVTVQGLLDHRQAVLAALPDQ